MENKLMKIDAQLFLIYGSDFWKWFSGNFRIWVLEND